ncbi:hypothetical protein GCM10010420_50470 [Streptomyces glaucosporus]|uniref:Uncharacterized protein n=1 Tax=Streptomyces glaucosporus TaxID=284044 RepID=A0ABN3IUP2_9ACTN
MLPGSREEVTGTGADAVAAEAPAATPVGRTSGSAAAAAQATPIEDAMNARINPIVGRIGNTVERKSDRP